MKDDIESLRSRLEALTSRNAPQETKLNDEEAAALRESWLALNSLLQSAESEVDFDALLRRLDSAPSPRQRPHRIAWALAAVIATAACLLIALAAGWYTAGSGVFERLARDLARRPFRSPGAPLALQAAWHDGFDARIDHAERGMSQRADVWQRGDASIWVVSERLHEAGEDLAAGAL